MSKRNGAPKETVPSESERDRRVAVLREEFLQRFQEASELITHAMKTNQKDDFERAFRTLCSSTSGLQKIIKALQLRILKPRLREAALARATKKGRSTPKGTGSPCDPRVAHGDEWRIHGA